MNLRDGAQRSHLIPEHDDVRVLILLEEHDSSLAKFAKHLARRGIVWHSVCGTPDAHELRKKRLVALV